MNRLRLRGEGGFTLIELLVVIAIIGILAAVAIPQFAAYRKRGFESAVKSDIKNVATASEAYFVTGNTYKPCTACTSADLTGYNKTAEVAVDSGGGASTFMLTATHANCGAASWTFLSSTGTITGPSGGCP